MKEGQGQRRPEGPRHGFSWNVPSKKWAISEAWEEALDIATSAARALPPSDELCLQNN